MARARASCAGSPASSSSKRRTSSGQTSVSRASPRWRCCAAWAPRSGRKSAGTTSSHGIEVEREGATQGVGQAGPEPETADERARSADLLRGRRRGAGAPGEDLSRILRPGEGATGENAGDEGRARGDRARDARDDSRGGGGGGAEDPQGRRAALLHR